MFALSTYLLFLKELSEKKRNSFVLPIEAFSPYPHPLHPYSPAELGVVCCLVAQLCLCPTPCKPLYYSPPGSSVHGIPQARILEWIAISSSRGSSQAGSPALQTSSLPFELKGKPQTRTDVGQTRSVGHPTKTEIQRRRMSTS